MIKLFISESAADKDLYDDLYSYADEYRMTSRWTKDNVEKYLKRQKNFRRMSDADFDRIVAKVNKDFKRKKKVKSEPYSETSYKTESAKRRTGKKSRVTEGAIYDLKEITGYDAEEIFRDDYYEDLEELWNNAEDIDDFIYDCFSEWLDEDFIYDFLANRVGINSNGLKDKIHKIYIYWRGDDVNESYKRLHEQDVEIEVKHEGILEVPEGKNVDDLPMSHFEKLAKKKGLGKITKALNNLQVWNKKKDPKLSKWAGNMIDKLNKKFKKDESWYERIPVGYKWRNIVIPSDDDFEAEIEEYIADLKLADDKIEWDIDYHGGVFGDDRAISLYSSGEDYTDVKYKVENLRDRYLYDNA